MFLWRRREPRLDHALDCCPSNPCSICGGAAVTAQTVAYLNKEVWYISDGYGCSAERQAQLVTQELGDYGIDPARTAKQGCALYGSE